MPIGARFGGKVGGFHLQEKTRAAAAPRKPKNGAVSSPLNVDDAIFFAFGFRLAIGFSLSQIWEILIAEIRDGQIWIHTSVLSLTSHDSV